MVRQILTLRRAPMCLPIARDLFFCGVSRVLQMPYRPDISHSLWYLAYCNDCLRWKDCSSCALFPTEMQVCVTAFHKEVTSCNLEDHPAPKCSILFFHRRCTFEGTTGVECVVDTCPSKSNLLFIQLPHSDLRKKKQKKTAPLKLQSNRPANRQSAAVFQLFTPSRRVSPLNRC